MFESTKTLSIMKLLTVGHLSTAKMEAGSQAGEGSSPRLVVPLLLVDELFKRSRKTTDVAASLRRQRPRALQELSVDGEGDLSLHMASHPALYTQRSSY